MAVTKTHDWFLFHQPIFSESLQVS